MRTLRKTIKWVFLLLVVGTVTGGGYAFYIWNESDELTLVELEGRVLRRGGRIAFCESVAKCKGKVLGRGMLTKMIIQAPKESKV